MCKGIIIGGIANNILGRPRFTADIDAVILLEDEYITKFLRIAKECGFIPRIINIVQFALKNRVILLKHKQSAIDIDISLGLLPFEKEAIAKSIVIKIKNVRFWIPRPEDLIIFKAVANREKDIMDIKEIVNNHPEINTNRIKKIVTEFSHVLEKPEIWDDIKSIITQKKKQGHLKTSQNL